MKEKQRSRIPLPVFNQKKKNTEEECDDLPNHTINTTAKLPAIPTSPAESQLCRSARRKIAAKRKTASAEQEKTTTSPLPTKPISPTVNADKDITVQRYPVARKLSMGALQQERVDLVMGREELAKEWLDNEKEKQQLETKLLHISLNMTTVENKIKEMAKRENELRCEVERR